MNQQIISLARKMSHETGVPYEVWLEFAAEILKYAISDIQRVDKESPCLRTQ